MKHRINPLCIAIVAALALASCERGDHHHEKGGMRGGDQRGGGQTVETTASAIKVGDVVTIAVDDSVYPFVASRVEIGPSAEDAARVSGAIKSIDTSKGTIALLGITASIDAATELQGVASIDGLMIGQAVEVDLDQGSAGFHVARLRIAAASIHGSVIAITGGMSTDSVVKLDVLGKTVVVPASAHVVLRSGRADCGHDKGDGDGETNDD